MDELEKAIDDICKTIKGLCQYRSNPDKGFRNYIDRLERERRDLEKAFKNIKNNS